MIRRPSNPTLLPTAPLVPPAARSRTARGLAVAATQGRFALQVCADCGRTQYPPREACVACLGAQLACRDPLHPNLELCQIGRSNPCV